MVQSPQRTAFSGPALVRLLTRLTDLDVSPSSQPLADRLSQWLGWTDAIALSTALNGSPPAIAGGARVFGSAEESECARVRMSLAKVIAGDSAFAVAKRRGSMQAAAAGAPAEAHAQAPVDYAMFRQRYQAMQQAMETGIGNLRGRLRGMLATQTPAMARLAVVDAVMERALGPREQSLLAAVPGLLALHFTRLREAAQPTPADADADPPGDAAQSASGAWLDTFRKDMQSVLLAELDVRLQPVEGLLAALRTR